MAIEKPNSQKKSLKDCEKWDKEKEYINNNIKQKD